MDNGMCVYVCLCVYLCMCVCVRVCMSAYVHVYAYACLYVFEKLNLCFAKEKRSSQLCSEVSKLCGVPQLIELS